MDSFEIRPYHPDDRQAVIELWSACGLIAPQNNPERDIDRKLQLDPEGFLVGHLGGRVIATCMVGYEGHRGWINYLAVSPAWQRRGLATRMVQEAETRLRRIGCPKINCQIRASNAAVIDFYKHVGFAVDDVVSMGMRLEFDGPKP
jgi:ribosomal protein S18 acetylase RimI-like enzyme